MSSTALRLLNSIAGWRLNLLVLALGTLISTAVLMLVERLALGAVGPNTSITGSATGVIMSALVVGVTVSSKQGKLDERALRDVDARFRAIFQMANVGVSIVERSGKYLMINPQWAQSLGYELQEMQCQTYEQVIPLDELEETRAKFRALLDGKIEKYRIEKRFVKKDRSVIWADLSTSALKDEREQVTHVVNVLVDITELKQAQDVVRQSKENYQILYAYAPVGILLANHSGEITEVNSAVLQILGSPSIEATKRINILTFPPLVECGISACYQRCFETGKPEVRDFTYTTMWGKTVQVLGRLSPIFDYQNRVIMVHSILEDITARRQTEEKIQQLFHALEQSPVSIVITDTKPCIEYVNQKFLDTTGYSMAEVSGKNPRFLQSGETPLSRYLDLWSHIANGKEWHGELQNRKKNGDLYWASLKISPITNSQGEIGRAHV